jgi:hypothetical protein
MSGPSRSSEFQELLDRLNGLSRIQKLEGDQRKFWDQRVANRLKGMNSRIKNWQKWGVGFRLPALAVGAAVPALAPFSGLYVRVATAALAAIAVVLNGAVTLFHTDQRTIVNRRYQGMLLSTGWSFALGLDPYNGDDAFESFARDVTSILEVYDTAYETSIYVPPTVALDHPAGDPARSAPGPHEQGSSQPPDPSGLPVPTGPSRNRPPEKTEG